VIRAILEDLNVSVEAGNVLSEVFNILFRLILTLVQSPHAAVEKPNNKSNKHSKE